MATNIVFVGNPWFRCVADRGLCVYGARRVPRV
jgi:hypothetical protein